MIREKALRFGKTATLIGVLTEPAGARGPVDRPVVLLLNSGILHRVGACRLHVQQARALAALGFTTLRFDHAGIGDSEGRRDTLPFEQAAVQEAREAMDYLEQTKGAKAFLVSGLCSGADMAHMVAAVDERVKGLFMLDPWAYRTRGYYLRHYGLRALDPRVVANFVRHRVGRFRKTATRAVTQALAPSAGDGADMAIPTYVRAFPPREKVAGELRRFVERGIRIVVIFSGGQQDCYNHEGQYVAAFPEVAFGSCLTESYYRSADHIFTGLADQKAVVEATCAWARGLVPAEAGAGDLVGARDRAYGIEATSRGPVATAGAAVH